MTGTWDELAPLYDGGPGERAVFVGGPQDGNEWALPDSRGGRLLIPAPVPPLTFDDSPNPYAPVSIVGVYEARIGELGRFARDDIGRLVFDWQGWS